MADIYKPRKLRRTVTHPVRGVDYRVHEWGRHGDPLLFLLHGWGDAGSTFQFMVDALERDWRVIAPDWRGFGESVCKAQSYWFPDYIADLDCLLDIYSPGEPVRIVGHSMGANVAGLYAGILPQRVAAFVNVEGFGLADSDPSNAPAHYRRWLELGRESKAFTSYESFDALVPRILGRSPRMSEDKAQFVARRWAMEHQGRVVLRADPAHRLPNAIQYRRAEAMACWAAVVAPVLLVLGAETDFTKAAKSWIDPHNSAHPFRTALTTAIPDCGHMVHFEQPEPLAAAVEDFLTRNL